MCWATSRIWRVISHFCRSPGVAAGAKCGLDACIGNVSVVPKLAAHCGAHWSVLALPPWEPLPTCLSGLLALCSTPGMLHMFMRDTLLHHGPVLREQLPCLTLARCA